MAMRLSLRLGANCTTSMAKTTRLLRFQPRATAYVSCSAIHTNAAKMKTFEPDYLDAAGLTPPAHPKLNIQLKGYDFDILESFQSYVHNLAENLGIDVSESWATPCTSFNAHIYAPQSTKVASSYSMNIYERNVQLSDVLSTDLPVLIEAVRKTLPEGVSMSVHEHKVDHFEERYIPDPLIISVREELEVIEASRNAVLAEKRAERDAKAKAKKA